MEDSGSRNAQGRNNLSGGILIEEGSTQFEVRDSVFERIAGNGLWTHSLRISPRLEDGVFAGNRFDTIGRDAIQVGAASRVRVEDNTGANIGYPVELVDVEHGERRWPSIPRGTWTPASTRATGSRKSMENASTWTGFTTGRCASNQCVNRKPPGEYPFGHFGCDR